MTSAFISYQHVDRPVAAAVKAELIRNEGVDEVFIDYQDLRGGEYRILLGKKIVTLDYFVVLISPSSVESREVRWEIELALREKQECHVIPFLIEEIDSWQNVYPLLSFERVQLQFNSTVNPQTGRSMQRAIKRLEELMALQDMPRDSKPRSTLEPTITEESEREIESNGDQPNGQSTPPEFSDENINNLFESASGIQSTDPERAMFLYQLVIDIDPDYLNGGIIEFVERQRVKTKRHRLQMLIDQAEIAKRSGKWSQLGQLAHSMLEIDPENTYAVKLADIATKNVECEPMYEQAKVAHENGNKTAVTILMHDIQDTCPDYGDPAGLLADQPITKDLLRYVRNSHTLEGHTGPINKVAFSNDSGMLATASTDCLVKVWSTSTGELLCTLKEHIDQVNSVAFSSNGQYVASVCSDGKVVLWNVENWRVIQEVDHTVRLADVAFLPDCKKMVTCGNCGYLHIHNVPQINSSQRHEVIHTLSSLSTLSCEISSIDVARNGFFACSITKGNTTFLPVTISEKDTTSVHLWRTPWWTKVELNELENEPLDEIRDISLSNDGKYLATCEHGVANVWKLPRGRNQHEIYREEGHGISAVTFSPNDSSLLVCADEGFEECKMLYFDVDSRSEIQSQFAHPQTINSISMSPDGRYIATGSDDCTAKIWQL